MVRVPLSRESARGQQPEPSTHASSGLRLRRLLRTVRLLAMLVLLTAFAPNIVSLTGTAHVLLEILDPELAEIVSFDDVNLAWWSRPQIHGLKVKAEHTALNQSELESFIAPADLLHVRRISAAQPLWQLLLSGGDGIALIIESAQLGPVDVDQQDWLPAALQKYVSEDADDPHSSGGMKWSVTLSDTTVLLRMPVEKGGAEARMISLSGFDGEIAQEQGEWAFPRLRLLAFPEELPVNASRDWSPGTRTASVDMVSDTPIMSPAVEDIFPPLADGRISSLEIRTDHNPENGEQTLLISVTSLDLKMLQPVFSLLGIHLGIRGTATGGMEIQLQEASLSHGLAGRLQLEISDPAVRQLQWAAGEWLEPGEISVAGAFAFAEDGLLFDQLHIDSEVLSVFGDGVLGGADVRRGGDFEFRGNCSLNKIFASLPQTIRQFIAAPLHAGELNFSLHSGSDARSDDWKLTTSLTDLQIRDADGRIRRLPELACEASGTLNSNVPRLSELHLSSACAQARVTPVDGWSRVQGWVDPRLLSQHLAPFLQFPQLPIHDAVQFDSLLKFSDGRIEAGETTLTAGDLHVESPWLLLQPGQTFPKSFAGTVLLQATADNVNPLLRQFVGTPLLAPGASIVARCSSLPGEQLQLSARVSPGQQQAAAVVSDHDGSAALLQLDEARLVVEATAVDTGQRFEITSGLISLPGLNARILGGLEPAEQGLRGQISSRVSYNLDLLSGRLFAADSGISVSGAGETSFTLQLGNSPTDSVSDEYQFEGAGSISWSSARMPGFSFGPGTADLILRGMELSAAPITCELNRGSMTITPRMDFSRGSLQLATGSRFERVQLTPDLSAEWLSLLSPLLVETVGLEGTVSARIHELYWMSGAVADSKALLDLQVHQLSVQPGEFAQTLHSSALGLIRRPGNDMEPGRGGLRLPEQSIRIEIADAAVHHDRLLMQMANWQISSSGQVGFDHQIDLVLQLPAGGANSDQLVSVPVRGSLAAPRMDLTSALREAGLRELQRSLQNSADQQLNQGLNRLLNRSGLP